MSHTFGQSALLARRLVEHGVTFVTVNCVPWDHHGTSNRYATEEGARLLIPPLDQAIAALVNDLIERGMYEKTLIVAMGEFGRTPRMNSNGGRDHWGRAFSVLMGCGSMNMGQTIGQSSSRGETVVRRPLGPQDVALRGHRLEHVHSGRRHRGHTRRAPNSDLPRRHGPLRDLQARQASDAQQEEDLVG